MISTARRQIGPHRRHATARHVSAPCICLIVFFVASASMADDTPRTGVIDDANVINGSTKAQINQDLLELEQKTGAQLKVWTMNSTNGRDIYSLAIETARKWKLGQKGRNNGCLVAIAVKDRKWRIVTGEGIEDVLPDLLTDRIAQAYFVPFFRQGNYSQGIHLAVAAMATAIASKENVTLTGVPKVSAPIGHTYSPKLRAASCLFSLFLPMLIIVAIAAAVSSRRRYYSHRWGGGLGDFLFWNWLLSSSGSRSRGWRSGSSSWGSFGSGGFGGGFGGGGFGGGGGGSFGGGGSGGSW